MSLFDFDSMDEDTYDIPLDQTAPFDYDYNNPFGPTTRGALVVQRDESLNTWSAGSDESEFELIGPEPRSLVVDSLSQSKLKFEPVDPTLLSPLRARKCYFAPRAPSLLMPTNFRSEKDLDDLIQSISSLLTNIAGVDFEFAEFDCYFRAVYVRCSSHCGFNISLYESREGGGHIIEAQRLEGDGLAFGYIYNQLQENIIYGEEIEPGSEHVRSPYTPDCEPALSDESIGVLLSRINDMAKDKYVESKLEACRIFCDLASDDKFRDPMCTNGCVQIIIELVVDSNADDYLIRQHGILALAELSKHKPCREVMIDSTPLLSRLLDEAQYGSYYSLSVNRESTRILANLANDEGLLSQLVDRLGVETLKNWADKIDELKKDDSLFAQAGSFLRALKSPGRLG